MVKVMNKPSHHWSQTSSRLMNACPRAWALTYGRPSTHSKSQTVGRQHQPRTFDEVLTRTMRAAWRRKVEDLYQRKIWSTVYSERTFAQMVNDALSAAKMETPPLYRQQKIKQSLKQIQLLEQSTALRPLVDGQPRRWAYFDRLDSTEIDGVEFYAAPDLAVYHQHRWTLVRIQFRSPRNALMTQQLEHLLTVVWALNNEGFPNHLTAFRLKVIQWKGSRWNEHSIDITPQLMEQAIGLMRHDVQEMAWLSRWATADPSLNTLPLAVHNKHCKGCHHRKQCPAVSGLAEAKLQQQSEQLGLHQSEATKSPNTA